MKNLRKKTNILLLSGVIIAMSSCGKDEDPIVVTPPAGNGTPTLVVPPTYAFTDAAGASTVSNGGQVQRLEMLSEMVTYMKTGRTGAVLDAQKLKNMYANSNYTWADASGLGMTGSSKQLKNKTAFTTANGTADAGVQSMFESYIDSLAAITALQQTGSLGVAGLWEDGASAEGKAVVAATGIQYLQWMQKGLMSAVFMSQITVHYLSIVVNDNNTDLVSGKNYTAMERSWDEAYGYFTNAADYPTNGDVFWGKYALESRESVLGSATKLSDAFRRGRAAIVAKDMTTRDAQITIIRNEFEKLAAGSAIHYLNVAKSLFSNNTDRTRVLSECTAFLNGMQYGYNAISGVGMSSSDIDLALAIIGNDFNNITLKQLNDAIDFIAPKVGISATDAAAL